MRSAMLMTCLAALIAFNVGFVFGAVWRGRC